MIQCDQPLVKTEKIQKGKGLALAGHNKRIQQRKDPCCLKCVHSGTMSDGDSCLYSVGVQEEA